VLTFLHRVLLQTHCFAVYGFKPYLPYNKIEKELKTLNVPVLHVRCVISTEPLLCWLPLNLFPSIASRKAGDAVTLISFKTDDDRKAAWDILEKLPDPSNAKKLRFKLRDAKEVRASPRSNS
jgi:hypothetical protein